MARANHHATYPARFQFIAAMNPCRCGYLGDPDRECSKAPRCGSDYQSKISGPMLDRIDIQVHVPAVSIEDLDKTNAESSEIVAKRVKAARDIQAERFKDHPISVNAHANGELLEQEMGLSVSAKELLTKAATQMRLSARGYYRLIRVSRTIADLESALGDIQDHHVAEAISYRSNSLSA